MGNIWRRLFGWEADGWRGWGRDLCLVPWAVNPAVIGISPFPVIPGKRNAAAAVRGCGTGDGHCGARMLPGFLCDFWHWGDLLVCEGHPILAQEGERPGLYFPLSLPPLSPPLFFPCLGFPSNPPWYHPHLQHPWVQPQPLLPGQIWGFSHLRNTRHKVL